LDSTLDKDKQESQQAESMSHTFAVPPSQRQTLYQICDIKDKQIARLVQNCQKDKCDKQYGWLTKSIINKISQIMKNKVPRLLSGEIDDNEVEDDKNEHEHINEDKEELDPKNGDDSTSNKKGKEKRKSEGKPKSQIDEELDDVEPFNILGEDEDEIIEDAIDEAEELEEEEDEDEDEDTSL